MIHNVQCWFLRCIYFPTIKLDSLESFQSSLSINNITLEDSSIINKNSTFQGQRGGLEGGISKGQGWVWGHERGKEHWWWYGLLLHVQVYMSL